MFKIDRMLNLINSFQHEGRRVQIAVLKFSREARSVFVGCSFKMSEWIIMGVVGETDWGNRSMFINPHLVFSPQQCSRRMRYGENSG